MTSRIQIVTLSGALALLMITGSACGGSNPKATAQREAVERALEAAGDSDDDTDVTFIVGDGGTGEYSIKTNDGSMTVKSGGSLPEGFPSEVVIPARWVQVTVSELSSAESKVYSLGFTVSGDVDTAVAEFRAPLESNGFEVVGSMLGTELGDEGAAVSWQNAQWLVSLVMGTYDGEISVAVSVSSI